MAGVLGAALATLSGALVFAITSTALSTADETGHVDYAFQLWHGRLPIFENGILFEPTFGNSPPVQWEAQHPPLFYALLAPAVGLLADSGHPMMAVMAARLISSLIATCCVIGIGWAAGQMTVRPQVSWVIMVAAVAGPISPFLRVGGSVFNDDLAVLFTVLALGVTLRAIRAGVTRRVMVFASLVAAGGMLSRANFVATLLTMCSGLVLAWWIRSASHWQRRLTFSIGIAMIPATAAIVAAGWFYLRNIRLSGSWTGGHFDWAAANLGRATAPLNVVIAQTQGGWALIEQLFQHRPGRWITRGGMLVALLVTLSTAVLLFNVVRRLTGRHRPTGPTGDPPTGFRLSDDGASAFSMAAVLAVQLGITMAMLFAYVAGGGAPITRYLLPALLPICVAFAYGLFGIGRRLRAPVLALYSFAAWGLFVSWVFVQPHTGRSIIAGRTVNSVPGVLVLIGLLGLLAGVAITVIAVHLDQRRATILPDPG